LESGLEMPNVKLSSLTLRSPRITAVALAALLATGCSTVDRTLNGDRIDYRSQAGKTAPLDVPPDLTQLQRDTRYAPQQNGGTVSASAYQAPVASGSAPAAAPSSVAPQQVGEVRVQRSGEVRYLVTSQTPEQLWPQLRSFWQDRGFNLALDSAQTGVMETDWAEDRSKLPQDIIRSTLGRVIDNLYSTGIRDKFRTRVERTPQGTEIYISHRRMEEVLTGQQREQTVWTPRPADPQLEAEMLSRLMVQLGQKEEAARAAVAAAAATPAAAGSPGAIAAPRARVLAGQPAAALQLDEPFDRAWRRVGLALDRSGFTVEDRDRKAGVYFVRYAETAQRNADKTTEKGMLSRMFGWFGKSDDKNAATLERYRITVQEQGAASVVSVLNNQGAPDNGAVAQRIVGLLVNDLK
jgi:outer membrane protein assembly factor BamC